MRAISSLAVLFAGAGQAQAHLGHVGELAGHSHWVAVGAAAAATIIAAWFGKRKLDAEDREDESVTDEEGEAAPAEA